MDRQKITLEGLFGEKWAPKEFDFQKAELILKAKKRNPSQTWRIPEGSDYTFDGVSIKKVEKKAARKEQPLE